MSEKSTFFSPIILIGSHFQSVRNFLYNFAFILGQKLYLCIFFSKSFKNWPQTCGNLAKSLFLRKKEAFFADYSNRQSFPKCEKFTRYLWVPYVAVNKLINGTAVASWLVHYYLRALWTMEFYITGHENVFDNWPTLGHLSEFIACF